MGTLWDSRRWGEGRGTMIPELNKVGPRRDERCDPVDNEIR